ncbi:MAG: DUF1877 family protein [Gammaproteobacteria bacterium]
MSAFGGGVTPEEVSRIDAEISKLEKNTFRTGYDKISAEDYDGELGTDDFEYTWDWFQSVRALFAAAAARNLSVLFSVDQ